MRIEVRGTLHCHLYVLIQKALSRFESLSSSYLLIHRPFIMKFLQALCETVTRALGLSTLAGYDADEALETPIGRYEHIARIKGAHVLKNDVKAHRTLAPEQTHLAQPTQALHTLFPKNDAFRTSQYSAPDGGERELFHTQEKLPGFPNEPEDESKLPPGPVFKPPNASPGFYCDYSAMRGWKHAAGGASKTAWLEKPIMDSDSTGGIYNIFTNYDQYAPIGTLRKVRAQFH